jgi:hypothetical protein
VVEVGEERVRRVVLHPTRIENFRVRRARGEEVRFLQGRIRSLSAEFGSELRVIGDMLELVV